MKTRTASTENPTSIQAMAAAAIKDSDEFREVSAELTRLRIETATLQAELDRELARATDVDGLVDRIESGEELSATDCADRIRVLRDQIKAYGLASARAERRRKEVLQQISDEHRHEFERLHSERMQKLVDTFQSLGEQIDRLGEIPAVLRGHELGGDSSRFPTFHFSELQPLKHRLGFFAQSYRQFLNGGE